MRAFELRDLKRTHAATGEQWHEFLRVPDLSMGLYILSAGEIDPQMPHGEDEVYYVVSGRGQVTVDGENRSVEAGSIIYVAKNVEAQPRGAQYGTNDAANVDTDLDCRDGLDR